MIDAVNPRHEGPNTKAVFRAVRIVTAICLFLAIAVNNFVFLPTAKERGDEKEKTIGKSFYIEILDSGYTNHLPI
jgi:hypothetical protein